jgi:hypothetical protein
VTARSKPTPDDILAEHREPVRKLSNELRSLIKQTLPDVKEVAYPGWHAVGFRHPRAGYVCAIFPFESVVRLVFEWGVLLRDDTGLLKPGGKQVRYAEFSDAADGLPEDDLERLLLEAVSIRAR